MAETHASSPARGPAHPDTLASRALVAQILTALGHHDEALPIVQAVAEAYDAGPALGPAHPRAEGISLEGERDGGREFLRPIVVEQRVQPDQNAAAAHRHARRDARRA